jgi:LPS export ABC transporter permease LptF/LPS export ABC transporter permease LptG
MKLLDRYILREILGYALLGLAVFLFILMTPEVLRLSELLAQETVTWRQVGRLFLNVLPEKLAWAIPLSVLTGLLMGTSRLAADSEVIALHAVGIGPGRLLRPLLLLAVVGGVLTALATVWGGPAGARALRALQTELATGQVSYELEPRVFDERFPRRILYVQDTEQGGTRWRGVFLADVAEPMNPTLTVAESALVLPDPTGRSLLLQLSNGSTHTYLGRETERYSVSTFAESILAMPLPTSTANLEIRRNAEMGLEQLWIASRQGPGWRTLRADFHRRLALPASCLLFGLVALPMGMLAERSGRAVGFVLAVGTALAYYFIFLLGDRLGRQGDLWPGPGVWLANGALLVAGLLALSPAARWLAASRLAAFFDRFRPARAPAPRSRSAASARTFAPAPGDGAGRRRMPRTLDVYVVRGVLFYFLLQLCALVFIFALFTVLEMADDIAARNIPWSVVGRFLWYLLPQLLYWMAPLALLLGVLVELALLSKRNELVAIMGAGISLYRIAIPIVVLGAVLSGLLFWLDQTYLPYANQRREAIGNQIKGRPPQTVLQAERRWVFGDQPRIYHFAYFDPSENLLARLTVVDLDPATFAIRRRLYARRAAWDAHGSTWVFSSGWERSFSSDNSVFFRPLADARFPELAEPPTHFQREIRESAQMNVRELSGYIGELRRSGLNVTRLLVQWHKKFSFPLMATIIVFLGFPFGQRMGNRGALGGLAAGIALGFTYWVLGTGFFEALGNLGLLPPILAAWGANLVFVFGGFYLMLQIDT